MKTKFDILFIGAGPAGYSAAAILGNNGKKVAVIEKKDLGGTCVNEGCIPTKTLLKSAKLLNDIKNASVYGIQTKIEQTDYKVAQQNRKDVKNKLNNAIQNTLNSANVQVIKGEAKMISANQVVVNNETIEADNIVIATGARSRQIKFNNIEKAIEENRVYLSSTNFLVEENLPNSLLIYGGGPVSLEFAYTAASYGVQVTIVEYAPKLLSNMDEIAGIEVTKLLEKHNIQIITNSQINDYLGEGKFEILNHDGTKSHYTFDKVLLAVGRVPNTEVIGDLDIKLNQRGFIEVDQHLRTSIPNVFAIGDVTGALMLTTTAYKHGDILIETLLDKQDKEIFNPNVIAWAIYLNPELAGVGLNEKQAIAQYGAENVLVTTLPATALPRNHADHKLDLGFFRIITEKSSGKILGSLIFLENASLIINELALAISQNLTVKDLQAVGHTHPTTAEAIYYSSRALGINKR